MSVSSSSSRTDTQALVAAFATTESVTIGEKTLFVPKNLVAEKVLVSGVPNPLEKKNVFVTETRTANLEVRPGVIHFGGFLLQHLHEQTLKIINCSKKGQRMHILPPQTSFFTFKCDNKGKIPPGLAQIVTIQFMPDEWRYFYDCLRIHADGENLIVPIHAYPVVNQVEFPSLLDLGRVTLHQSVSRTLVLKCNVPIEFDFSIDWSEPSPYLSIQPLSGVIPANGAVEISVVFSSARVGTLRSKIVLHISQYDWEPLTCEILATGILPADEPLGRSDGTGGSVKSTPKKMTTALSTTQFLTQVHDKTLENLKLRKSAKVKIARETEEDVKGMKIRVPADPYTLHAATYMLTQDPDKLSVSQLKSLIAIGGPEGGDEEATSTGNNLDPKTKARLAVEAHDAWDGKFRDCDEDWGRELTQQEMQIAFEREARLHLEYEKAKDIKWFVASGEIPPSVEEIEDVEMRREERRRENLARKRERQRQMNALVLESGRVVNSFKGFEHSPDFDPYKNDAWRIRKQALSSFVDVLRILIVRQRLDKRLALLEAALVGQTPEKISQVLHPPGSAVQSGRATGGERQRWRDRMNASSITPQLFPLYLEDNFRDRQLVETSEVELFEDWDVLDLKVGQESKLLGYQSLPLPPIPSYVSPELQRPLRVGAEDEEGQRGPRGPFATVASKEALIEGVAPVCQLLAADPPVPPPPCPHLEKRVAVVQAPFIKNLPTDMSHSLTASSRVLPPPHTGNAIGEASSYFSTLPIVATVSGHYLPHRELPDCIMARIPTALEGVRAEDAASYAADDNEDDEPLNVLPKPPTQDQIGAQFKLPPLPSVGGSTAAVLAKLTRENGEKKAVRAEILKDRLAKINNLISSPKLQLEYSRNKHWSSSRIFLHSSDGRTSRSIFEHRKNSV